MTGTFTEAEIRYLSEQQLGRLATVGPDGGPYNVPVGYDLDPDTGCIEIGGIDLAASGKFRNVARNPLVALVVDDIPSLDPLLPRGIQIRGRAVAVPATADVEATIRIRPTRVVSWGIYDSWQAGQVARDVVAGGEPEPVSPFAPTTKEDRT